MSDIKIGKKEKKELTRDEFMRILNKVTAPIPKPPVQGKSKQEK